MPNTVIQIPYLTLIFRGPLECAPDLSDPMSAATYAAEEISAAKDEFVRHFSDEEGTETCGSWRDSRPYFDVDAIKATFLIVSPRRELLPQLRRPCGHWQTSLPLD